MRDARVTIPASVVFLGFALGSGIAAGQSAGSPPAKPEDVQAGKELFGQVCAACHGSNGEGGRGPNLESGLEVRRESDQEMFDLIRNGVRSSGMPAFSFPDSQIRQLIAFIRSLNSPAIQAGVSGDPEAGREVFFGKGRCSTCHMIRGQGGYPGPDLSEVGARRTLNQIQESLLKPSTRIADGFRGVTAVTADGQVIEGVAKSSTNYSLVILDPRGQLHFLSPHDLKSLSFRGASIMPGDYAQRLTSAEVQNLLAFLSKQATHERAAE
jgi:putative heme-binding domain-containing protein